MMTFAPTYKYSPDFTAGNEIIVYGTITATGSYASGGDTLNLTGFDVLKTSVVPLWVQIQEMPAAGTVPSGYTYFFCPGTTLANGKVAVFLAGTQLAAGAYPGGVTGASINIKIWALNQ